MPAARPSRWLPFVPAAIYLGVRGTGMLVLAAAADTGLTDRLTAWDGLWYLKIAAHGYDLGPIPDADGHPNPFTRRAFFPAYPALLHALSAATGLNLTAAALLVSAVAGLVTAYGLARLGRIVRGGSRRAGHLLVALFAAAPMGIVLSMAYTEALFCALAVWVLVALLERRWLPAALGTAAAGLVRPTSLALVVVVVAAALLALHRRRDGLRPLAAALLAPAGLFGYLWWTGLRVHPEAGLFTRLGTWSELEQQGWATRFDGGAATLRFLRDAPWSGDGMTLLTVAVVLASVVLPAVALRGRLEWPLTGYAVLVMVQCLGSTSLMHAKPRLLLPAFTLLIPAAIGLAKRRRGTVVLILTAATAVSAWYGAYALTVWKYAI
ncbi:hypothetical protein FNH05_04255 [Amycolatopsis rhizosphaerae]|uniref:Glycosyltransferase RgtA/B/C/D-like domain-containing protein n=2 Tax=Amycolatopsis rhizosphaerae TaxID=2053003 RepID=A0A558DHS5_9PSEU|nr:hypothetical protein FNH05_04255 [Amycolatopsis rhizosphaerae]